MNAEQDEILRKYAELMSKRFDSLDCRLPTIAALLLLREIVAAYERAGGKADDKR